MPKIKKKIRARLNKRPVKKAIDGTAHNPVNSTCRNGARLKILTLENGMNAQSPPVAALHRPDAALKIIEVDRGAVPGITCIAVSPRVV